MHANSNIHGCAEFSRQQLASTRMSTGTRASDLNSALYVCIGQQYFATFDDRNVMSDNIHPLTSEIEDRPLFEKGALQKRTLCTPLLAFTRHVQLLFLAEQFIAMSAFRRMCFFYNLEGYFGRYGTFSSC